ncbi:MAG: tRNA (guanosine(37)-N1)-methyltransferase TrmD, partial [Myxococcales bacterium]|nr:tRNA (guanosine(37)-N1)-methyltransferase TrmD [Myxococcales bacterium]
QIEVVSIGDYVLTGGEYAALVVVDAVARLLPGVLGNADSSRVESFAVGADGAQTLEFPQYTRPVEWEGRSVPDILLSGHHAKIEAWRAEQGEERTHRVRPDLRPDLRRS